MFHIIGKEMWHLRHIYNKTFAKKVGSMEQWITELQIRIHNHSQVYGPFLAENLNFWISEISFSGLFLGHLVGQWVYQALENHTTNFEIWTLQIALRWPSQALTEIKKILKRLIFEQYLIYMWLSFKKDGLKENIYIFSSKRKTLL